MGSSSQSMSQQHDKETIKQVQQKLSEKGHKVQADGIMGPKTQQALKAFQEKNQLEATGELDPETLAELGVEGASSSTGGSSSKGASGSSAGGSDSSMGGASSSQKEK